MPKRVLPPAIERFYSTGSIELPVLEARGGVVDTRVVRLERSTAGPTLDSPAFHRRLAEIAQTIRMIGAGAYRFHLTSVNRLSA